MNPYVKDILLLILGVVCSEAYKRYQIWRQGIIDEGITRGLVANTFNEEDGYMSIDHANPFYELKNVQVYDSNKHFYIDLPGIYTTELKKLNFEGRTTTLLNNAPSIEDLFAKMNITFSMDEFVAAKKEVAEEILRVLKSGVQRFNGLMYGVDCIMLSRTVQEEESVFSIGFYKTDYYTYSVMGNIYKKLKERDQVFKIGGVNDINKYTPFLPSFGLAGFVIFNRGNGDEVLIGKRSQFVGVDKGKWHFSFNEAFSMKDKNVYEDLSLEACFFRALKEELGINNDIIQSNMKRWALMHLHIDVNRFETGVSSFVKMKIDENFTYEDLLGFYSTAQDGKLETSTVRCLLLKDIPAFIAEKGDEISATCRGALMVLYYKYRNGYFKDQRE
jgi:hypothetical protein